MMKIGGSIMSKILVVEDDEMLNAGICFNLQKAGHEPIPANDLTSAQPFIKKQAVDLILLDLNLPEKSNLIIENLLSLLLHMN